MLNTMQRRRGFTIVELLVVIVIIVILLGLSVLSISKSQANARDAERNADMASIARGLESRYKEGNSYVTAPSYVTAGSYPGVYEMQHILGANIATFTPSQVAGGYVSDVLTGTVKNNFSPPDVTSGPFAGFNYSCTSSCGAALSSSAMGSLVTTSTYYYQPIDASGNVCLQGGCVRFQLFWRTEVDNQLQSIESKHQ